MKYLSLIFASLFGVGYFPLASGTVASFVTLPFIVYTLSNLGIFPFIYITIALFFLGVFFSHFATKNEQEHDPSIIVIDEAMGQFLTFALVAPSLTENTNLWIYFWGFIFFRIFDTLKVQPAKWIDTSIHNAFGVMLDDAVAGVYAAFALYTIHIYFFSF